MTVSETDDARLANAVWHALRGPQASLAQASDDGRVRRFDPEVSPFGAVAELDDAAWAEQARFVGSEGVVILFREGVPPVPEGWKELVRMGGLQLVAGELPPAPELSVVELGSDDVPEMLELTRLTEPGPFLPRTIEMGRYLGVRRGGRLVAMAGERLRLPGWTEVSAVCTHPDAQRQGLGAAVTLHVAESIRARGDGVFLHVLEGNDDAIRLYRALGFEVQRSVHAVAAQWFGPGLVPRDEDPGAVLSGHSS